MKKIFATAIGLAVVGVSSVAFAQTGPEIVIRADNNSSVVNRVYSTASTGGNVANGADATNSTSGGNISEADYANVAGNGGSTVLGGMGGIIQTGNALSTAHIENRLNTNRVRVEAEPWAVGLIDISFTNAVEVDNHAEASGSSGGNTADGSTAVNTVSGGDVTRVGSENRAGNGGSGVEGGSGGAIGTGSATSHSSTINVLNRNIFRVRR